MLGKKKSVILSNFTKYVHDLYKPEMRNTSECFTSVYAPQVSRRVSREIESWVKIQLALTSHEPHDFGKSRQSIQQRDFCVV